MTREVFCTKLQRRLPGIRRKPYPGELGEKIFAEISQEAWDLWLEQQTMIINENRLVLSDPDARKRLVSELRSFLFAEEQPKI